MKYTWICLFCSLTLGLAQKSLADEKKMLIGVDAIQRLSWRGPDYIHLVNFRNFKIIQADATFIHETRSPGLFPNRNCYQDSHSHLTSELVMIYNYDYYRKVKPIKVDLLSDKILGIKNIDRQAYNSQQEFENRFAGRDCDFVFWVKIKGLAKMSNGQFFQFEGTLDKKNATTWRHVQYIPQETSGSIIKYSNFEKAYIFPSSGATLRFAGHRLTPDEAVATGHLKVAIEEK